MNEQEFVKTLQILKKQPKQEKGFSFRRTIKTLQQARKMQAVEEYRRQLLNATGVDKDADQ